jgi:hypothetical protein
MFKGIRYIVPRIPQVMLSRPLLIQLTSRPKTSEVLAMQINHASKGNAHYIGDDLLGFWEVDGAELDAVLRSLPMDWHLVADRLDSVCTKKWAFKSLAEGGGAVLA